MITKEEYEKIVKEEGDYMEFEAFGLPCVIWRNKNFGHWCGYAGVPKDSRLDGKRYYFSTESENGLSSLEKAINEIEIHGGLTYAGKRKENWEYSKKDDIWYFGFDCGHYGDLQKYQFEYPENIREDDIYRTKEYVIEECKKFAEQLKKMIELNL